MNFKTLGYTEVQYERERERDYLLVMNVRAESQVMRFVIYL